MTTIALATAANLHRPDLCEPPLRAALAARGVTAVSLVWNDPAADFGAHPLCVIRSTWDYHRQRDRFVAWAERVGTQTRLENPARVIRWNTHKHYLAELEQKGAPIIPTEWVKRGQDADLSAILKAHAWETVVIKPAVSAGAWSTLRVGPGDLAEGQAHLARLLETDDMMIQPYLASVAGDEGERSLIFLDGQLTHSVRKFTPLGATAAPDPAPVPRPADDSEAAVLARRILAMVPEPLLYARVDLARDAAGVLRLMELELTEPSLFLDSAPPASADRLADAIVRRLGEKVP